MKLKLFITLSHVILLIVSLNMAFCEEFKDYFPQEREALLLIRDSLSSSSNLHKNWTGPPCINNQSRWKGINCSNWHVIHIVLEGINFSGSLPSTLFLMNITFLKQLNLRNNSIFGSLPNLTNLVFLEQVYLSYNHFSGSIPVEYAELPNLKVLELEENYLYGQIPPFDQPSLRSFNVSYNHLVGPIPETSALKRFSESSFGSNSDLCGKPLDKLCSVLVPPSGVPSPSPAVEKHRHFFQVRVSVLIASAAAAAILLLLIAAFLVYNRRVLATEETRRNDAEGSAFGAWAKKMVSNNEDYERLGRMEFFSNEFPAFDMDDLLRASGKMLGKGELGITYKATLETGPVVAVKRLSQMDELSKRGFLKQMQLLGKMKHQNLVEVISYYYSEEQKLIIYEYISSGTLFELLHESRGVGRTPLDWNARIEIVKDIAKGLTFLHHSLSSQRVPHANLKSSNVLIEHDIQGGYHSKLTDFGFFQLLPSNKLQEKLAISKSPEFVQGKKRLTHKADVYCFGIIMLEVITGKIPGEMLGEMDETTSDLSDWVRMVVNNDWSTDIFDVEILAAKEGHDSMLKLTEIALDCTDERPEKRPKMSEVLRRMEEIEQMRTDND